MYPPPLTLVWIIQELISVVICRLSLVFSFVFCHTCVILSRVIVVFHLTFVVCHWSQWKSSVMCSFLKEKVKVEVLVRSQELRILANCNQIDLNCSLREAILVKKSHFINWWSPPSRPPFFKKFFLGIFLARKKKNLQGFPLAFFTQRTQL